MPRARLLFIPLFAALLAWPGGLTASAEPAFSEYKVKAEFIERIAEFVDWPESAFSGPQAPFVIAIAGEDPFGRYLDEMARTRTIKGRAILLRHVRTGDSLGVCHLLFIASSEYGRLSEILASASPGTLILGDGEKFAKNGAQVGLYPKGGRLRFEINLGAARKSGLVISPKILRLAVAVYGGGGV